MNNWYYPTKMTQQTTLTKKKKKKKKKGGKKEGKSQTKHTHTLNNHIFPAVVWEISPKLHHPTKKTQETNLTPPPSTNKKRTPKHPIL